MAFTDLDKRADEFEKLVQDKYPHIHKATRDELKQDFIKIAGKLTPLPNPDDFYGYDCDLLSRALQADYSYGWNGDC